MIFEKKQKIANYTVMFPHKEGSYAETYRVKDENGKLRFLKLINLARLNSSQFGENGEVIEVEVSKKLNHKNLCNYVDSGSLVIRGGKYVYVVTEFVSAETAYDKLNRNQMLSVYETKQIALSVLEALKFIHTLDRPIIHNEVTPQNALLNLVGELSDTKLIDFGHARFLNQPPSRDDLTDINPFYLSPERFNGICSVQSDLYSVGVMIYQLIFGVLPWFLDLSKYKPEDIPAVLNSKRKAKLPIPDMDVFELDAQLLNIMAKAMAYDTVDRFQTADEFIKALNGEIEVEAPRLSQNKQVGPKNVRKGNGFKDVAGMQELKDQLQSDVIDLLEDPEQAQELGLHIPNGILFYGPPGCGKTYFAEKLAEEIGCNFMEVDCSNIASPYIHGGQEKIAAMFDEARNNAPTILFLDEVDSMLRKRSMHNNVSESGEVNVFLTNMNNCGMDGVIVIGATNQPTDIDEAALRAGRFDLKYYIPQPDKSMRSSLFKIHLSNRRTELAIDYDKLADLTENRVSVDIKFIVDTAARMVHRKKTGKITMDDLLEAIANTKPSVSLDMIKQHERIRDEFMGEKKSTRPHIGFR